MYKRWWLLPTMLGLGFEETVVNVDRMREIHPALLVT